MPPALAIPLKFSGKDAAQDIKAPLVYDEESAAVKAAVAIAVQDQLVTVHNDVQEKPAAALEDTHHFGEHLLVVRFVIKATELAERKGDRIEGRGPAGWQAAHIPANPLDLRICLRR